MPEDPVDELVDDDVQEPEEQTLEDALEQLKIERAAREKADRDLSSLKGQLRASTSVEDAMHGELSGIYKYLDILAARSPAYGDGTDDADNQALSTIRSEREQSAAQRELESEYEKLTAELLDATSDEDGNPLFADRATAPELERVRELWSIGQTGLNGNKTLDVPERINQWTRAVAEAAKQARLIERKNRKEAAIKEKEERGLDRKRQASDDGDLDLSTPDLSAIGSGSADNLSPVDRIARGLAAAAASGKRSSVFVDHGPKGGS